MEYISGNIYLDFLNYSSVDYINFFLDSIFSYFDYLDSGNSSYYSDTEFIKCCIEKLDSIKDKLYNKDFIIYLEDKIKKINKSNIPRTFCHGDLTLSNILFSSDSLFFLDFLDSYVDSWIVDLVKIKQDLYYLWNVKKDTDFPNLRSVQISLYLWKKIEDRYKDIVISEEFKILEILNFLRIYPYIKTEKEKLLLNEIIERIPIYEEFNNTHGGKIL
jgi:thiamine kinase-like enzyme